MIDKLEAGKKYRLIDKEGFLNDEHHKDFNRMLLQKQFFDSDLCIVIDEVHVGYGKSLGEYVISPEEFRFFELVDENPENEKPKVITPETEVTITTTYGELARAYCVISRANGFTTDKNLFFIAGDLLNDKDRSMYRKIHSITNTLPALINYNSIRDEWESLFFTSKEQQEKELAIKQKRDQIEKLQKEIQELGGE